MTWAYAGDVAEYKRKADMMRIEGDQIDVLMAKYEVPRNERFYKHCWIDKYDDTVLYCAQTEEDDEIMWAWTSIGKPKKEVWEE